MRYLSKTYFDYWLYEIDIINQNKKTHLSLNDRIEVKRLVFKSYSYFKEVTTCQK